MTWLSYLNIMRGGLPLVIKVVLASLLIAVPVSLVSGFFVFSYGAIHKVVVALLSSIVVGYIFKENRSAIDKIRNYDYSKFNINKKQRYATSSAQILSAGNDKDIYNILYYLALLIIPMFKLKDVGLAWLDVYVSCLAAVVPFVATVFYLVFFNERKTTAEKWLLKLDEQSRIEEGREKMIENLRKAINSHEPKADSRSALELTKYLEHFASSKEETSGTNSGEADSKN